MTDDFDNIRDVYNAVATEYALRYFDELEHKPLDRALLDRLVVDVGTRGPLCDMGCGPGQVARYLRSRGAEVVGIDLSPKMVAEASRRVRDVVFDVGNILALNVADGSWGGIAAFYSLIHLPPARLPAALRECRRALTPGGSLLAACHLGEGTVHMDDWWGRRVRFDARFFEPGELEDAVAHAGYDIVQAIVRDPIPDVEYQSRRVYVLARKPLESPTPRPGLAG
jgi:SAM-dependent methyltransferase